MCPRTGIASSAGCCAEREIAETRTNAEIAEIAETLKRTILAPCPSETLRSLRSLRLIRLRVLSLDSVDLPFELSCGFRIHRGRAAQRDLGRQPVFLPEFL